MPRPKKRVLEVDEFSVATGIINLLKKAGVKTELDFQNFTSKDLQDIEGMGPGRLAELKLFLKGRGVKLKKNPPKEKKPLKWDPQTREVLLKVQNGEIENYAQDMKRCGMMIERFGIETIMNLEFPATTACRNLRYFFSGGQIAGWVSDYVRKFAPMRIAERQEEAPKPKEVAPEPIKVQAPVETHYEPIAKAPRSLADFLKQRKNEKKNDETN